MQMKTKNSYTTETYIAKAKSVHDNKYDYSKTVYENIISPTKILKNYVMK